MSASSCNLVHCSNSSACIQGAVHVAGEHKASKETLFSTFLSIGEGFLSRLTWTIYVGFFIVVRCPSHSSHLATPNWSWDFCKRSHMHIQFLGGWPIMSLLRFLTQHSCARNFNQLSDLGSNTRQTKDLWKEILPKSDKTKRLIPLWEVLLIT